MLEGVIRNKEISIGAKIIYVYLELISKEREVRDKSVSAIGGETVMAHQAVYRYLQGLQEDDLIDRETKEPKKPQIKKLKGMEEENIER